MTLADLTGDGRADLVAARPDGTLHLDNNGGSNSAPTIWATPIGSSWQQFNRIMAADVTGDYRADILATRPEEHWHSTSTTATTAPPSAPAS